MSSFFLALAASLLAALPTAAFAADDDVPFFVGIQGLPNVMVILDNSDSMQDVPYPAKDESGNPVPVRPDWPWRQGVKIDESGFVVSGRERRCGSRRHQEFEPGRGAFHPRRNPPDIPGPRFFDRRGHIGPREGLRRPHLRRPGRLGRSRFFLRRISRRLTVIIG